MSLAKFNAWLTSVLSSMGGLGIFAIGFLDSSVLTFPVINDLLVITLSIRTPALMPFYALMAMLGSLAGSVFLYYLARKGGEAMLRKRSGSARAARIHAWLDRNSFLAIAIPSILPPPMPFKLFVLAAGVFRIRMAIFIAALLAGRGFRYFGEGYLAVRYGNEWRQILSQHWLLIAVVGAAFIIASFVATRMLLRPEQPAA